MEYRAPPPALGGAGYFAHPGEPPAPGLSVSAFTSPLLGVCRHFNILFLLSRTLFIKCGEPSGVRAQCVLLSGRTEPRDRGRPWAGVGAGRPRPVLNPADTLVRFVPPFAPVNPPDAAPSAAAEA
ncbi:hypothetical protein EVAR_42690_1 [Eumeta japonica]|uniref:Uncharacterized protein n=1 Tax=Eumeta variegata TaxID=151549 RepID=A0A4C1WYE8_EUMVA|nr:hypothetical protein EVAR_42690_1 [Eumeta japonica]